MTTPRQTPIPPPAPGDPPTLPGPKPPEPPSEPDPPEPSIPAPGPPIPATPVARRLALLPSMLVTFTSRVPSGLRRVVIRPFRVGYRVMASGMLPVKPTSEDSGSSVHGVKIAEIGTNSPAAYAGMQVGDSE